MPAIRYFVVCQTRKVKVSVVPTPSESYEQAALRVAHEAFENPGQPGEGMQPGVHGMPEIVTTTIQKSTIGE
jgi:hypothetical protein